jgi:hypothetical protein
MNNNKKLLFPLNFQLKYSRKQPYFFFQTEERPAQDSYRRVDIDILLTTSNMRLSQDKSSLHRENYPIILTWRRLISKVSQMVITLTGGFRIVFRNSYYWCINIQTN